MITQPFTLFAPFSDRFAVAIFTKEDDVQSDEEVARRMSARDIASLWQAHGNRTIVVTGPSSRTEQADGMLTERQNLALSIRWADCQNFVVYDPVKNVCGLLHVGWRGLIADIIPEFFRAMEKQWGIRPESASVGAGPSLCMDCAEFGEGHDVLHTLPAKFVSNRHADLQGAATAQLIAAGVRSVRIERRPECTRCQPETYWTYRGGDREAVQAGHGNVLSCVLL